ncbi:hypothetical protein [Streptomyces sp. NPDC039028]|uniref:hypothetical protein n=1 Tax=unclassified Streptomyces TaxID=2593676 RepID=UPI0033DFC52B
MGRRSGTKNEQAPFGIPVEIVLIPGQDAWAYRFIADDGGGACGKVRVPADTASDAVQDTVVTTLADLTRTWHGVEIEVAWSPLVTGSWAGRILPAATAESMRADGGPGGS